MGALKPRFQVPSRSEAPMWVQIRARSANVGANFRTTSFRTPAPSNRPPLEPARADPPTLPKCCQRPCHQRRWCHADRLATTSGCGRCCCQLCTMSHLWPRRGHTHRQGVPARRLSPNSPPPPRLRRRRNASPDTPPYSRGISPRPCQPCDVNAPRKGRYRQRKHSCPKVRSTLLIGCTRTRYSSQFVRVILARPCPSSLYLSNCIADYLLEPRSFKL